MNTHETLLLKTLQAKQLHKNGGDTARFIDAVLDQNPEEAERLTKNVCARIPGPGRANGRLRQPARPEQAGNHHHGPA